MIVRRVITNPQLNETIAALKKTGRKNKAPTHPRRPDTYVRRVIRGMLPRKKPKGRTAFRRVRVYIGVPEEYRDKSTVKVPGAEASKLRCAYITVGELSNEIGAPWKT